MNTRGGAAGSGGPVCIRPGGTADLPALPRIERAAGEVFRSVGMDAVADDEPPTERELAAYAAAGRLWTAAGRGGEPVAYLLADVVDGCAHIEQVTVHPGSARRGIGSALVDQLAVWAAAHGLPAVTLTTFADVPWNAPYYARCGFRLLPEPQLAAGLRRIREREAAAGLDRWPRVCMRRESGTARLPGVRGAAAVWPVVAAG